MTSLRKIGTQVSRTFVGDLVPEVVLDELDQPLLFTARLPTASLALVYFLEEGDDGLVRLVVPTDEKIVKKLKSGETTLREALQQPWAWLSFSDEVRAVVVEELPEDCLPRSGTYLHPDQSPLLSVRLTGDISENNVTASVISRATDAVRGALKQLLEFVANTQAEGRPTNALRRLYDLPARRWAFGSLEIDFGAPSQLDLPLEDSRLLTRASSLLQRGLEWVSDPSAELPPSDDPEWRAILSALRHLVPPRSGAVEGVEVDGLLAPRGFRLDRRASRTVSAALKTQPKPKAVSRVGFVREFDRDKLTFILREEPYAGAPEHRCWCEEGALDDVDRAFDSEERVTVVGFEEGGFTHAIAIGPAS